jgi:MFS family permease
MARGARRDGLIEQPGARSAPPASAPPGSAADAPEPPAGRRWAIPAPPDRFARNLHLLALGILAVDTVYWLSQPCNSDFLCATVVGVFTLALLVPGLIAVGIWRLAGRASPILLADAFLVSITLPLLPEILANSTTIDAGTSLLFVVLPAVVIAWILGPVRDVAAHRIEAIVVAVALFLGAAYLTVHGWPAVAIIPLILLLVLRFAAPRSTPEPEWIPEERAAPPAAAQVRESVAGPEARGRSGAADEAGDGPS